MDSKKRRSSILKKATDDDVTVDVNTKQKRRISFSVKKSVREFNVEEHWKAYDNSYEEPDQGVNGSAESGRGVSTHATSIREHLSDEPANVKTVDGNSCIESISEAVRTCAVEIAIENTKSSTKTADRATLAHTVEQLKDSILVGRLSNFALSLDTTRDSISSTRCLHSLHIENTPEISLYDYEYIHPSISFSVEERELQRGENSITSITQRGPTRERALPVPADRSRKSDAISNNWTVFSDASKPNPENKWIAHSGNASIKMEQTVQPNGVPAPLFTSNRRTICMKSPMEISLIEQIEDKENMPPDVGTDNSVNAVCDMEIDSSIAQVDQNYQEIAVNLQEDKSSASWKSVDQEKICSSEPRGAIPKIAIVRRTFTTRNTQGQNACNEKDSAQKGKLEMLREEPKVVFGVELPKSKEPTPFTENDDIKLDNTLFLTYAKLGDETVCQNSSFTRKATVFVNGEKEVDCTESIAQNPYMNRSKSIRQEETNVNSDVSETLPPSERNSCDLMPQMYCTYNSLRRTEHHKKDIDVDKSISTNNKQTEHNTSQIGNTKFKTKTNTKNGFTDLEGVASSGKATKRLTVLYNTDNNIIVNRSITSEKGAILEDVQNESDVRQKTLSASVISNYGQENKTTDFAADNEKNELEISQNIVNENIPVKIRHRDTRKTLHFTADTNMELDCPLASEDCENIVNENIPVKIRHKDARKTLHFTADTNMELDCPLASEDCVKECENIVNENILVKIRHKDTRKTLHFTADANMELDCSLVSEDCVKECDIPLNVAKHALVRQSSASNTNAKGSLEDSLSLKLREVREETFKTHDKTMTYVSSNEIAVSPPVNSREQDERMRQMFEGTPHRSVIEFEQLEIEAMMDIASPVPKKSYPPDLTEFPRLGCDNRSNGNPVDINLHDSANSEDSGTEYNLSKLGAQHKIASGSQDESVISWSANTKEGNRRRFTTYEPAAISVDESGLQFLHIDDNFEETKTISLIRPKEKTNSKRTTESQSPIHPLAKKRLTQLFNDYILEESVAARDKKDRNSIAQNNAGTMAEATRNTNVEDVEVSTEDFTLPAQKFASMDSAIKINFPPEHHEKEINCTPANCKKLAGRSYVTRIPIPIGSGRKSNLTAACTLTPGRSRESNLDYFQETICEPRRAVTSTSHKESVLAPLLPLNLSHSQEHLQCLGIAKDESCNPQTVLKIEENPITVSDVSVYYSSQRQSRYEVTCTDNIPQPPETGEENKLATLKRRYVDLTCDSRLSGDDIDETRLSMVETLLHDAESNDDDESDDDQGSIMSFQCEAASHDIINDSDVVLPQAQPVGLSIASLRNESVICRKCKRCQEFLPNESAAQTEDSFALSEVHPDSELALAMDRLKRIRSKPNIAEVSEYWRRKSLEQYSKLDETKISTSLFIDEEKINHETDSLISELMNRIKRVEIEIAEQRVKQASSVQKTFVQNLKSSMSISLPNWIFDYQMQSRKIFLFTHKKIITTSLLINYEERDAFGREIDIKEIKVQHSEYPKKNWKPFHHVLDFQLRLELPFNLRKICPSSDVSSVSEMLREVDRICVDVEQLGRCFWKLVCKESGSLRRNDCSTYVEKIVREVGIPVEGKYCPIQETEFKIEVRNLRKICFKDIISPPLHLFREDIQDLPIGLEFLKLFLRDPVSYMKK